MKKIVLILLICLLAAGCGSVNSHKDATLVVEQYLNNSVAGGWDKVYQTLSGEALAESKVNSGRVQTKGEIFKVEFEVSPLTQEIAVVSADVVVKFDDTADRVAYDFKLQKTGGSWKIYKATYGDYLHPKLKKGKAEQKAIDVARDYIELPFEEKRIYGSSYLAGKLKQDSIRSASMPLDESALKKQANVKNSVKEVNCLGTAKGYSLLSLDYETILEGISVSRKAVVEMVEIDGDWKIGSIDIMS